MQDERERRLDSRLRQEPILSAQSDNLHPGETRPRQDLRRGATAYPPHLAPEKHRSRLDKLSGDYYHIPKTLMPKHLPKAEYLSLPHLNRHHVEAQGLLYHLHEDGVFCLSRGPPGRISRRRTSRARARSRCAGRPRTPSQCGSPGKPLKDQIYAGTKAYQRIVEENK